LHVNADSMITCPVAAGHCSWTSNSMPHW